MPPGPLRQAVDNFLTTNPLAIAARAYVERVVARDVEYLGLMLNAINKQKGFSALYFTRWAIQGALYVVTGLSLFKQDVEQTAELLTLDEVVAEYTAFWQRAFQPSPDVGAIEALGAVIAQPMLAAINALGQQPSENPEDYLNRVYGVLTALTLGPGIAATAVEVIGLGQVESPTHVLGTLTQMLGMGALGGTTTAAFTQSSVIPDMQRALHKRFRPERFRVSELRDLYALGEIDFQRLLEEGREQGWREADLMLWVKLAFKQLTEADVWALYHKGYFSTDEVVTRLRSLGFDPADIPALFVVNQREEVNEAELLTLSTARSAFRDGLLSEADFRAALAQLGRGAREIDLMVQLEAMRRDQDLRSLTVGQIKAAWTENVLTDAEARHWIAVYGFGDEEATILLNTWRGGLEPPFRKLNAGTITAAYVNAVLTRQGAFNKLVSVGFTPDDARLTLDLAEARNPEIFGAPAPKPARQLSISQLADSVIAGLITPSAMFDKLVSLGFSEGDAQLLTDLAVRRAQPAERALSPGFVVQAYMIGVLTREEAGDRLVLLGISAGDAELQLRVADEQIEQASSAGVDPQTRQHGPGVLFDLLRAGIISAGEMQIKLEELDYAPADAAQLVQLAVVETAPQARVLSPGLVGRAYLAGVLDRPMAKERLVDLGVSEDDAETTLLTIEAENPAVFAPDSVQAIRLPSTGAVVEALRLGIISEAEYFARMAELGYDRDGAETYKAIALSQEWKKGKDLTPVQTVDAYEKHFIPFADALRRLSQQGYSNEDALLFLRLRVNIVPEMEPWKNFLAGLLAPEAAFNQLFSMGFTPEEIDDALVKLQEAQSGGET